ncbi:DDE Tnp4 domain-containing protein [Trichonephila clavipes]|nr:DDE Tnp4 domain-containing protein [Trichonephila clavipes]
MLTRDVWYFRFEAINGQHKKWRALNNIIPNVQIPYIGDYVEIVSPILNVFHPARLNNIEDDNVIVQQMLDLVKKPNCLQQTWYRARNRDKASHDPIPIPLGYHGRRNPTQTKTPRLGYADTLQDAAHKWSSGDSASESQKET